jgi:cytochrome c553
VKTCSLCGVLQPKSEFYRHKPAKDGLKSNCKKCHDRTANSWRAKDVQRSRKWHAEYRIANKATLAAQTKKYAVENKARRKELKMRRRAAHARAVPSWADRQKIAEIYAAARSSGLTVDHIVPLNSPIVCGLHVEHNLQLLSRSENASKRNWWWPDMPG